MSFSKVTNPVLSEHEIPDDKVEEKSKSESNSEKLTKESAIIEPEPEDSNRDPASEPSETSNLTWQAVWSNEAQTYYYWNTVTNETKWEIPQEMYTAGSLYDGSTNNSIASTDQAVNATTATADGAEYTQQEYYQYYYAQYGYYPEGYYYGYDPATYTSTTQTPAEPPNPLESILDRIDTEVKSKLDGEPSTSSQQNASSTQQESSTTVTSTYDQDTKVEDSEYYSFLAQHGDGGEEYKVTARFNARTGKFQRDPTLTPEKFSADSKAIRQMSYFFDYDKFAEQRSKKTKLDDSSEVKENKRLNKKDIEFFKQKKKEKKEMKKKAWLMGGE
ncbi:10358_t:CDS:1 [Acaulospora colombiana]|uniref:10358_t:CDS:1 n=1 Tax=Acaulospora colombiana TaxID=27376 RepID=A0ACA9LPY6_9GLOM|nr:10358_t:CDS:1 [Acaulospora colombiana]